MFNIVESTQLCTGLHKATDNNFKGLAYKVTFGSRVYDNKDVDDGNRFFEIADKILGENRWLSW